jgi:hypothetical protein
LFSITRLPWRRRLDLDHREFPFPVVQRFGNDFHVDAFDRAGGQAQFATGALLGDDRVHLLGGADDGIDRAGLDAQRAADAGVLVDDRHLLRLFLGFQRLDFAAEQVGQALHAFHAARRAQVDVAFIALGDGFGVGLAAGEAALAALRLRQDGFDLLDQRVALDLELDRGKTQRGAEDDGAEGHDGDGEQDIHYWYLSRPAKPMKASAIRPAVTMAMAEPRKCTPDVGALDALADAGEEDQHQRETDGAAGAEEQRFDKVVAVGDVEQRHAEHGTIGGDQRQVDAQRLLQGRRGLGDDHFGQLDDGGDGDDEGQRAQVLQPEGQSRK